MGQPKATRILKSSNSQREWGGGSPADRESPRPDSRGPRTFRSGESWASLRVWGARPGSWSLCWSRCSRLSRRRSTWAWIWLSSARCSAAPQPGLLVEGPESVPPGPGGRGQGCQGSRPAPLLRAAQLLPSPADEGCTPSLTLYLPWGRWLFLGALWGLKLLLTPMPMWVLMILTGT